MEEKTLWGYKGKVCVVTGSSNGMGLAVARLLVQLGAEVYAVSRSKTNVEGLAGNILCDLSNKTSIDEAFAQIPKKIDAFFGVAGLSGAKTDYRTTFHCDFTANKYITERYLRDHMPSGSSITFVTSTAGLHWEKYQNEQNKVVHAVSWEETDRSIEKLCKLAPPNFAYIFAKRCLSQYAAEQSLTLGQRGIRVNNVMPGATETGMKDEFEKLAGGKEALLSETGVSHRLATPEEMAGPIVFLGSALASFVSGVDFCVDSADHTSKILKVKKDNMAIPATNPVILIAAKKMMASQKGKLK